MPPEMAPARISSSKSSQQTISSRHSPVNDELTISEETCLSVESRMRIKPPFSSPNFQWTSFEYESKTDTCGPGHHIPGLVKQNFHEHLSVRFIFWFLASQKTNNKQRDAKSLSPGDRNSKQARIIIACKLRINWGAQLPNQLSSDMCSPLHGRVGYSVLCRCGLPIYQCCWTGCEAGPTVKNSGFFDMSSLHVCFKHECTMLQNDMYTAFKTNWNPYCKNHDIDRYLHLTFRRSPHFPLGTEPEKNKWTKTQERCKSWTGLSRVKGHLFPQKKTIEKKTP